MHDDDDDDDKNNAPAIAQHIVSLSETSGHHTTFHFDTDVYESFRFHRRRTGPLTIPAYAL